jgi:hypothetical protein
MYRKDVNEQSPIRILDQSIHGGLGKGNLGVVMARAGVGKTACLVQIGLDDLMREKPVLHVAIDQGIDHVQSWYDALFEDLTIQNDLDDAPAVHAMIAKHRIIVSFMDHDLWPERLEKTVKMFTEHADFKPAAILVDGYSWAEHSTAENAAMIGSFKSFAKMVGAELWMSAQTHRGSTGEHPTKLVSPCAELDQLIDVALFLEPDGDDVAVRLLKDHGDAEVPDIHLHLHPDTLRLVAEADDQPVKMPNSAFTLLSGGATGAESTFGSCAETWGLTELNFTFDGHAPERDRALVALSDAELQEGAVSPIYIKAHMHRSYPDTPLFKKTLQSIWHQVNTAGEVFAIGAIQEDGTVRGGTGWAAELARHWHKPVHVFDQAKDGWFKWSGTERETVDPPVITHRRFTGTGTRALTEVGREAIQSLFERSFGEAPKWSS